MASQSQEGANGHKSLVRWTIVADLDHRHGTGQYADEPDWCDHWSVELADL